jgi:hypothetical protein
MNLLRGGTDGALRQAVDGGDAFGTTAPDCVRWPRGAE